MTRVIEMGQSSGSATLSYNTMTQEDQVVVQYEGSTIFDSGCVGENQTVPISFNGSATTITVSVNPNCNGGTGTAWNFTLNCAQ